jgi:hypothetical protein
MVMINIDFGKGKIIYNDFRINFELPYKQQLDKLKEDLLQVNYNNYLLDLGWYPEFDINGSFVVQLIYKYDWENPIYKMSCKDKYSLEYHIKKIIFKYNLL